MSRLSWTDVTYTVNAKSSMWPFAKRSRNPDAPSKVMLLDSISGQVKGGDMLAIMGPSGAGKSTLLDVLADRKQATSGSIKVPGDHPVKSISNYVEQHDALLGVLTVRETLWYSAKLSMDKSSTAAEINERVDAVLDGLGLRGVAHNKIGTPIQRGISGGQKRRVTIGCSLVAMPSLLFLDEPTSGLDIHTAYEVMHSIQQFAKMYDIAIVATIHSPNWDIFRLFSNVLLLAHGKTVYTGPIELVAPYFEANGQPCGTFTNPADHMMRLVSDDFKLVEKTGDMESDANHGYGMTVLQWAERWKTTGEQFLHDRTHVDKPEHNMSNDNMHDLRFNKHSFWGTTWTLSRRNLLNYRRNLLAYGVRFGMYIGMGVLLATIWVNLPQNDTHVQDRLSVHFFSVAFLGFMSVAGIPSFLEERGVLLRERSNGLYGPGPFTLANTIVSLPFLFICSLVFAILCYWSIGLHPGGVAFWRWLVFLYLGILAAEMQSLLIAALVPIFVAALALAAFLNGFWMCTQGYFIRTVNLPRFWYYWAHFINYETYAFALLARTDLMGLQFPCNDCTCQWPVSAEDKCASSGDSIIKGLQLNEVDLGGQAAILVCIVIIYRLVFYAILKLQRA
ncbi:ABC-type transporter [Malassezia pachydermatis]|uniref:p-loop containing nucleoside triphosphate hydrolase protein n=1 Tax=Malassezia pachydermatis TaxID=77020 RepID=A0A0M8MPN3_9BASI|nr:p-loop containing nucleoside triphosphate hydrolase protein [Malassezia pachydermatis]KOS15818.1 p-loop containing nucleoside triphosphate hydrolase protein [Malassezia pachydermatis]